MTNKNQKATFGAGCFWGVEEIFRTQKGVKETAVGYMGGTTKSPTYEDVCADRSGHAEVVHIQFDPQEITYETLLTIFWKNHDPTTMNQQGPDVGTQYRSVIFYHTKEQQKIAIKSKQAQQKKMTKKIVTVIVPAVTFYLAEEYHQKYLLKRGLNVCH